MHVGIRGRTPMYVHGDNAFEAGKREGDVPMRQVVECWWGAMREAFGLEKPTRHYAIIAGGWLSMFLGSMLFSVAAQELGYGALGAALTFLFAIPLIAVIPWMAISHIRDQARVWNAEIERQVATDIRHTEESYMQSDGRRLAKRDAWREEHEVDCVYFIVDRDRQAVKIGVSCSPSKRLKALQTSNAHELELAAVMRGSYGLEQRLHVHYAQWRLTGEWFELSPELIEAINHARESESPSWRHDG